MKKFIYALILPLLVVGGLVFANHENQKEPSKKTKPKPLSAAERQAGVKAWEATTAGINYKKWQASPAGKKVLADAAKIKQQVKDFSDMEAEITSLTLPAGSRLGFGVMARINGTDYILSFAHEKSSELQQLRNLKVNDKIIIRSRAVSHAPKYTYPIISGDYVERDNKIIYKRIPRKDGC